MENNVPYVAFEGALGRMERANKRLAILCIILIVALIASNVGWLMYERQYQDVVVTQEVEQETEDGNNNFIGIGGDNNAEIPEVPR